ncbi:MAG: hypothetical protein AAF802_30445 [Planctomycetota bacterium]
MLQTSIGIAAAVIGFLSAPMLRQIEAATCELGLSILGDDAAESLPSSLAFLMIDLAYYHSLTFAIVIACTSFAFFDRRVMCVAIVALMLGYAVEHLVSSAREIFASDNATGYRYQIEVAANASAAIASAGGSWLGRWLRTPQFSLSHLLVATVFFAATASTTGSHTSWQASTGLPLLFALLTGGMLWQSSLAGKDGEPSVATEAAS